MRERRTSAFHSPSLGFPAASSLSPHLVVFLFLILLESLPETQYVPQPTNMTQMWPGANTETICYQWLTTLLEQTSFYISKSCLPLLYLSLCPSKALARDIFPLFWSGQYKKGEKLWLHMHALAGKSFSDGAWSPGVCGVGPLCFMCVWFCSPPWLGWISSINTLLILAQWGGIILFLFALYQYCRNRWIRKENWVFKWLSTMSSRVFRKRHLSCGSTWRFLHFFSPQLMKWCESRRTQHRVRLF